MDMRFEDYFTKKMSASELEGKKKDIFVRLDKKEVVARLFDGKEYIPPFVANVVDIRKLKSSKK